MFDQNLIPPSDQKPTLNMCHFNWYIYRCTTDTLAHNLSQKDWLAFARGFDPSNSPTSSTPMRHNSKFAAQRKYQAAAARASAGCPDVEAFEEDAAAAVAVVVAAVELQAAVVAALVADAVLQAAVAVVVVAVAAVPQVDVVVVAAAAVVA